VFLMIFQYSACFGGEPVVKNVLATHFKDVFGVDLGAAGVVALIFWRHEPSLAVCRWHRLGLGESVLGDSRVLVGSLRFTLLASGFHFRIWLRRQGHRGWATHLGYARRGNMAVGTSYGIVSYMISRLRAMVSAVSGAGRTVGAVIVMWSLYKYIHVYTGVIIQFGSSLQVLSFEMV